MRNFQGEIKNCLLLLLFNFVTNKSRVFTNILYIKIINFHMPKYTTNI